MQTATPPKPVRTSVMLSPRDWRELRRRAIDQGRSASSIIRDLVQMAM